MCALTPTIAADQAHQDPSKPVLAVAVAVIAGEDGRYLLSKRAPQVHQGGRWEFPGGKIEPGETPEEGLARELFEELGVLPVQYESLMTLPFDYPEKRVLLHVFRVESVSGLPTGREGQALRWFSLSEITQACLPEANRGIVTALRLPDRYLITGEPGPDEKPFMSQLERALQGGIRLVQLRAKQASERHLATIGKLSARLCQEYGATLMLNGSFSLALEIGAQGVHLTTDALMGFGPGERPENFWLSASCHNAMELARACEIGVDFAVCSPVQETTSHPGAEPIGWEGFGALCKRSPFPLYALGGLRVEDIEQARLHGGQGIAGITSLWEASGEG